MSAVLMRTLVVEGMVLEPQLAAHAEEMFGVLQDPAIYEYENEPPSSVQWLRERFSRLETRRSTNGRELWLNWVVRLSSSELIGYLQASVQADGQALIAYVLSSRHWGKGLASQAVRAMIAELVAHYEVHTLAAVLKRENHRSVRLLERLGFLLVAPEDAGEFRPDPDEMVMRRGVRGAGVPAVS